MPVANIPVILNLLDGPVRVDPAFDIVWTRFRMMRRCLAHWPEEVPRIFRMLDLIAHGADGHDPVHVLLTSVAEIGFCVGREERGGGFVLPSSLSGCFRGLSNIFRALFFEA